MQRCERTCFSGKCMTSHEFRETEASYKYFSHLPPFKYYDNIKTDETATRVEAVIFSEQVWDEGGFLRWPRRRVAVWSAFHSRNGSRPVVNYYYGV